MSKPQHPKENLEELALVKVAAWTWYRHGPGSEQRTVSESDYTGSCDIVIGPSRYKLEAMDKAYEDMRVSTRYINNPLFSTISTESSLLDVYEIERISKDLDHYIECSFEEYYCHKSVDDVHRSRKAKKTNAQRKWFRHIYDLCGSNKGDVVENVNLATERRRASKKHIPMAGDLNFHRKAT